LIRPLWCDKLARGGNIRFHGEYRRNCGLRCDSGQCQELTPRRGTKALAAGATCWYAAAGNDFREGTMKLPHRRQFLHLAAGATALPVLPRIARAQAYPTRPVRLIVPSTPGGGFDTIARLIGQPLSERLGKPFVIETRPGAGTNIGTEFVVRASPDGYTLLLATHANAANATLYEKLNYNFIRDIVPVASISRVPNVMVVPPSFPAKTIAEFIAYAKANPGKITMGSEGNGAGAHMSGELFKMLAGIDMLHIPYRGAAPALTDLLAGQVQVMFASMPAAIQYVRAGNLRALAVTTRTRSDALPDIPAVGEFVPGYEAFSWYGIGAPRKTPPEIVERLNKETNAAIVEPKLRARFADLDAEPLSMTSAEFGKFIADETEKWGKVIRAANIKAE
jgi:tripartite-type tricarboxylate transporter receptor subunit TctC